MRLIDTHCHIDLDAFEDDRDEMLQRATEAGVSNLLVIGFEPERWKAAGALASTHDNIRVAAGLHPNSASSFCPEILEEIAEEVSHPDVIAIGETGIDCYWDDAPVETQKEAFRAQVSLARDLNVPFIVHQRDAETEVLEVLRQFQPPLHGVLHCFTGNWEYAKAVLELGLHIGLGGAITFKSRTDLHNAAARIPLERIVLETDSPYMAPVPYRGKRNEPAYIAGVAGRIAELRGTAVEDIAAATSRNAIELFPGLDRISE